MLPAIGGVGEHEARNTGICCAGFPNSQNRRKLAVAKDDNDSDNCSAFAGIAVRAVMAGKRRTLGELFAAAGDLR